MESRRILVHSGPQSDAFRIPVQRFRTAKQNELYEIHRDEEIVQSNESEISRLLDDVQDKDDVTRKLTFADTHGFTPVQVTIESEEFDREEPAGVLNQQPEKKQQVHVKRRRVTVVGTMQSGSMR